MPGMSMSTTGAFSELSDNPSRLAGLVRATHVRSRRSSCRQRHARWSLTRRLRGRDGGFRRRTAHDLTIRPLQPPILPSDALRTHRHEKQMSAVSSSSPRTPNRTRSGGLTGWLSWVLASATTCRPSPSDPVQPIPWHPLDSSAHVSAQDGNHRQTNPRMDDRIQLIAEVAHRRLHMRPAAMESGDHIRTDATGMRQNRAASVTVV